MELTLKKYFYWSAGLHATALLFLITSPYLPFNHNRFRQEPVVWVELPKGTTGDFGLMKKSAWLPKTTIEEQRKAAEQAPKKTPTGAEMTYREKASKRPAAAKLSEEEKRMKEALARVDKQVSARKEVTPEAAQIPQTQPGGFSVGTAMATKVPPTDPEYVIYQMKVRQRIMDQWILPLKFTDPGLGLICRINVRINERGEVIQTDWDLKSGNPAFDLSAQRAIEKAAPLDVPPERLKWEAVNEGFLVEFKPDTAHQ